jgi:hypothetical protein
MRDKLLTHLMNILITGDGTFHLVVTLLCTQNTGMERLLIRLNREPQKPYDPIRTSQLHAVCD